MRVQRPTATLVGVIGVAGWIGAAIHFEDWWIWATLGGLWVVAFVAVFRVGVARPHAI
jgi:hypothetical protein